MSLETDWDWSTDRPLTLAALRKELRTPVFEPMFESIKNLHSVRLVENERLIRIAWLSPSSREDTYDYTDPWDSTFKPAYELNRLVSQVCSGRYPKTPWGNSLGRRELETFRIQRGIDERAFENGNYETPEIACRVVWEICRERKIEFFDSVFTKLQVNIPIFQLHSFKADGEKRLQKIVQSAAYLIDAHGMRLEDILAAISEDQVKKVLDA